MGHGKRLDVPRPRCGHGCRARRVGALDEAGPRESRAGVSGATGAGVRRRATDTAVARRYRTTNATVGKWRTRFIERRLEGLLDEPRVGGPRTISDEAVEAVIVKTLETTPPGETHWSTRTMAAKAGMSHTMIGRIWRTFGLKPHITQSFKISPDPQLVDKIRDVVGLYMNPPHNAVVFCLRREIPDPGASSGPNRFCRWTSASPNGGRTTTCATARSICSPR